MKEESMSMKYTEEQVDRLLDAMKEMTRHSIDQDEQGGCVYCTGTTKDSFFVSDENEESHFPECEWVEGRKALLAMRPDAFTIFE